MRRFAAAMLALMLAMFALPASATEANPTPEITASSAIVVDATTGEVLYSKDSDLRLAPASLTKLFTAIVALESTPLDQPMTVSEADLVGEASMGLSAGETLPFRDLLYGMLLPSGNDAASTIARNIGAGSVDAFVARANARLSELGLADTALVNPHGLDADLHYASAHDIAAITLWGLRTQPAFVEAAGALDYQSGAHHLYQTNDLHVTWPGLIAGKTGVTDNAGYCLMEVAERDGRRVITVLLDSAADAWYADAELLLDWGLTEAANTARIPGSDLISFQQSASTAQPSTDPLSAPVQAQAPVTVPVTANGLDVIPLGSDSALVELPAVADATRRSPWLWLSLPAVLIPVVLLALSQIARPAPAPHRMPRSVVHAPTAPDVPARRPLLDAPLARMTTFAEQPAFGETQPFPLIRAYDAEAEQTEPSDPWHGWRRELRQRRGGITVQPSFGGD